MSSSRPSSPPPISSKRGRKRNDNLPPNRARDVQRAFRARRAAHLQALEQRVQELEDENNCLRQALNLPPANRPALGKGPTGKDKPKGYDQSGQGSPPSYNGIFNASRASSVDSPGSTRTSSLSPSMLPASSRPMQVVDTGGPWDQAILMNDQQSDVPPSASSSTFSLPPMPSSPMPSKSLPSYSSYQSTLPSARGSMSSMSSSANVYASPQPYAQSIERPLSGYASSSYNIRGDRRSVTDPQGYGSTLSQAQAQAHHQQQQQQQHAYLSQGAHNIRLPSPPRLPDGHPSSLRSAYGPDGTVNSLA
ncbi:hypothetical protein BD626DRAFT_399930 [Schizophyllum amplum]|uniref:BZIP domain-containing protein n=1 Tax=Schizophyllum amplum TaxID=97359 RepID=A0A550CJ49_9AGAR|nr:hypothetical protein BD626DRAFT_399930 [Auriculariopsis ampla]